MVRGCQGHSHYGDGCCVVCTEPWASKAVIQVGIQLHCAVSENRVSRTDIDSGIQMFYIHVYSFKLFKFPKSFKFSVILINNSNLREKQMLFSTKLRGNYTNIVDLSQEELPVNEERGGGGHCSQAFVDSVNFNVCLQTL